MATFPPIRRTTAPARTAPARPRAARGRPEDAFTTRLIRAAKAAGWMVVHFRPALLADGTYVTAFEGDAGFPDVVLARDGVVLIVELKSETGAVRPGQYDWLAHLGGLGRLWRPSDWDEIEQVLTAPRTGARERTLTEERRRVVRRFEKYTPEQRAQRAASHRLSADKRRAIGEYVYTHPDVPGRCFDTRDRAARAGLAVAWAGSPT